MSRLVRLAFSLQQAGQPASIDHENACIRGRLSLAASFTARVGVAPDSAENPGDPNSQAQEERMNDRAPIVKQLYRLSVEPRVVERLATLADRLGEPRSRLATRLFTDAVLSARPAALRAAKKPRA
jgi:hypothetical protein